MQDWHQIIRLLVNCPQITFPRLVGPIGLVAGEDVLLIIYWDSSDVAKAAVAYCRWLRGDGNYEVCLLVSKAKINALGMKNTP